MQEENDDEEYDVDGATDRKGISKIRHIYEAQLLSTTALDRIDTSTVYTPLHHKNGMNRNTKA